MSNHTVDFERQTEKEGVLLSIPLELSNEGKFLRYISYHSSLPKTYIEAFNYYIDNIIKLQFLATNVKNSAGEIIPNASGNIIRDVKVNFPKISVNRETYMMTPFMARENQQSYYGEVVVEYENNKKITSKVYVKIPIQLGSNRCYLSCPPDGMTKDEWKQALCECPSDHLGYFINNGGEKVLVNQEKLRTSIFMTIPSKYSIDENVNLFETTITYLNASETTLIKLKTGKKNPTVKVYLPHIVSKHYPLYVVFYLLLNYKGKDGEIRSVEKLFELFDNLDDIIVSFVREQDQDEVRISLLASREKFKRIAISGGKIAKEKLKKYLIDKRSKTSKNQSSDLDTIANEVFVDLFKSKDNIYDKLINLCYMTSRNLIRLIGSTKPDSRDSWANKRIDTPAKLIETLIYQLLFEQKKVKGNSSFNINDPTSNTKKIVKSFESKNWGLSAISTKENVVDAVNRANPNTLMSQCNRVNTPVSRLARNPRIRAVDQTQTSFICVSQTPEGEACGLVKHTSSLSRVSIAKFYEESRNNLFNNFKRNTYFSTERTSFFPYRLYMNGVFSKVYTNMNAQEFILREYQKFGGSIDIKLENDRIDIKNNKRDELFNVGLTANLSPDILDYEIDFNGSEDLAEIINDMITSYGYLSSHKSEKHKYTFLVNGDVFNLTTDLIQPIILWASDEFVSYLRYLRTKGDIPFDATISIKEDEDTVLYLDDSGRVITPFLRINQETNNLVADELDLWSTIKDVAYDDAKEYIDNFIKLGAIDYLDSGEYESYLVSSSIDSYRRIRYFRQMLDNIPNSPLSIEDFTNELKDKCAMDIETFRNHMNYLPLNTSFVQYINELFELVPSFYVDPNEDEWKEYKNKDNIKFTTLNNLKYYIDYFYKMQYCMIDPLCLVSSGVTIIPSANKMQGPRVAYQASMADQALSMFHTFVDKRFDSTYKLTRNNKRTMYESKTSEVYGVNTIPLSENIIVGIIPHSYNYEDALVLNEEIIDRHFPYEKSGTYKLSETMVSNQYEERLTKPKDTYAYRNIGLDGIPILGTVMEQGDCIIGMMQYAKGSNEGEKNRSLFAKYGDKGIVTKVQVIMSSNSSEISRQVKVKLTDPRRIKEGDKMALRQAQKGTFSHRVAEMDMMYIAGGPNANKRIDALMNIFCLSTRMTVNTVEEMFTSKAATYSAERVNASTFDYVDVDHWKQILQENGMDSRGDELVCRADGELIYDSVTGLPLRVSICPVAVQLLKHTVDDKKQARGTGVIDTTTGFGVKGRSNEGAQRVGEMEKDAMAQNKAILQDRMHDNAAGNTLPICENCNHIVDRGFYENYCVYCEHKGTVTLAKSTNNFKHIIDNLMGSGIVTKIDVQSRK